MIASFKESNPSSVTGLGVSATGDHQLASLWPSSGLPVSPVSMLLHPFSCFCSHFLCHLCFGSTVGWSTVHDLTVVTVLFSLGYHGKDEEHASVV
jgi:hypothetical protein